MTNSQAIALLTADGATLEKREDAHGVTRSGWWMDDVWLAPVSQPKAALEALRG
jgi:hypothetical protein